MKKITTPASPERRAAIAAGIRAAIAAGRWHTHTGPPWTPAEDARLGTAPDSALATQLRRSRGSIAARRHKLGIASPVRAGRPVGWRKHPDSVSPLDVSTPPA